MDGVNELEADIFLGPNCFYYVFLEDGQGVAAGLGGGALVLGIPAGVDLVGDLEGAVGPAPDLLGLGVLGRIDITDPASPQPLGNIALDGEPTAVSTLELSTPHRTVSTT